MIIVGGGRIAEKKNSKASYMSRQTFFISATEINESIESLARENNNIIISKNTF